MARLGIGSAPRIDASRTSSASASHSASVTSAITAIDQPIYRNLSSSELSETWPGMDRAPTYCRDSSSVTTKPKETMLAHTTTNVWWRSASGEIRSFSMNRRKKWRVRRRVVSSTEGDHICDVPCSPFRVGPQDQFGKHLFKGALRH